MSEYLGTYTPNLNLSKDSVDDDYSVDRVNSNSEKIDVWAGEVNAEIENSRGTYESLDARLDASDSSLLDLMYQTAGGTATALTLTTQTLVTGYAKTFIAASNNGGVATTINGKKLYKPATTNAPTLIAGKAYTVWYNASGDSGNGCFFIKASAEGTALASQVPVGVTFSNDNDVGIPGAAPIIATATITPGTSNIVLAAGSYLNGAQTIVGDADLISANIKAGINIFGVAGATNVVDTTISSSAAVAANIRAGYKCYVNGALVTGAATEKAAATITPGTANQTIAAGTYITGTQTISGDADLVAANIASGKNIFGIAGSATPSSLGGYNSGATIEPSQAVLSLMQQWGTATGDTMQCARIRVDSSGNIIVYDRASCTVHKFSSAGTLLWSNDLTTTYFTPGGYSGDINVDSSGNIYVVERSYSSSSIQTVVKLTSSGTVSWSKLVNNAFAIQGASTVNRSGVTAVPTTNAYSTVSASGSETAYSSASVSICVISDDGGVYCAYGNTLYRYNSSGILQWSKTITSTNRYSRRYDTDESSNLYVYEHLVGLRKINTSGTIVWTIDLNDYELANSLGTVNVGTNGVYCTINGMVRKVTFSGLKSWDYAAVGVSDFFAGAEFNNTLYVADDTKVYAINESYTLA